MPSIYSKGSAEHEARGADPAITSLSPEPVWGSQRGTGTGQPSEQKPSRHASFSPTVVPASDVAPNPINPREDLDDLDELGGTLTDGGQLQPCLVVSTAAFLKLLPQYADEIGDASYVVVAGSRRAAAARQAGIMVEITVKDQVADSITTLKKAALQENLHRKDLKPLEEARALAELMEVYGSQRKLAAEIGKTQPWVSQRLALLGLVPELQAELVTGALKVEDAREIGKLPAEQQKPALEAAREAARDNAVITPAAPKPRKSAVVPQGDNAVISKTPEGKAPDVAPQLVIPAMSAEVIAEALYQRLHPIEFGRLFEIMGELLAMRSRDEESA